jgi:chromatin assembly factor 1 subunit A
LRCAGTWSKSSPHIGPRQPFGKDNSVLSYEYDSEAEWDEDPDEGEDLSAEDGPQSDEALSEDEDDGFFCDDDEIEMMEGYEAELDHAELRDGAEHEQSMRAMAKKNTTLQDVAKRRKLVGQLVPVQIGPVWEEELGHTNNLFEPFRIEFLNGDYFTDMIIACRSSCSIC